MGSTFNPTQTYSSTGSTTAASTTPKTLPGTSSSTATQGSTTQPAVLSAQEQTQFLAANSIDPTYQAAYINGGQLTSLGQTLQWYDGLDQKDRQMAQTSLVALGYLTEADATGEASSTALSALKNVLTQGKLSDFQTALANPTTPTQAQITTNRAAAQKEASAAQTTPVVADLTDTNAANQTLSKAFEDALGFQPSAEQMNTFVTTLHAAQENEASGTKDAEEQAAKTEVTQANSEESALNNLGPDGLKALVDAYGNAIHGVNPLAGAGQQGPATGSQNNGQYLTPGSKLPSDTVVGFTPSGAETVANTLPKETTTTTQVPPGGLAQLAHAGESALHLLDPFSGWSNSAVKSDIAGLTGGGTPYTNKTVTTSTPTPGMATAPQLPVGLKGTSPSYGGYYALSPAIWQEVAKAANVDLKKYPTAGSAPLALQQSSFYKWVTDESDSGVSNSDIVMMAASGQTTVPKNAATTPVLGKTGTNLQSFASGIVNNVNSQIESIQNTVSAQQAPVVGKEAPNPEADALAAAESADPNQYIAHNLSLAEGTLQKMLYGTPQIEAQDSSDLAGDVAQVTASNSAAT